VNPAAELLADHARLALMARMEEFYARLTGCDCSAEIFVVSRVSLRGTYYVQRLGSCDFYEVNVKLAGGKRVGP
jgi:hypothetical protein